MWKEHALSQYEGVFDWRCVCGGCEVGRGGCGKGASRPVAPTSWVGQSRLSGKSAAAIADSAMRIIALLESSVDHADDSTWLSKARMRDTIGDAVAVGADGWFIRFGFFEQCVAR